FTGREFSAALRRKMLRLVLAALAVSERRLFAMLGLIRTGLAALTAASAATTPPPPPPAPAIARRVAVGTALAPAFGVHRLHVAADLGDMIGRRLCVLAFASRACFLFDRVLVYLRLRLFFLNDHRRGFGGLRQQRPGLLRRHDLLAAVDHEAGLAADLLVGVHRQRNAEALFQATQVPA